jgi:hypothetical protein
MVGVAFVDDLGMTRMGVISDDRWLAVEPLLPVPRTRPGRSWADHRTILEGICWPYRTGSPWREPAGGFRPVGNGVKMSFPLVQRRHLPADVGRTRLPVVQDDQVDLVIAVMSADSRRSCAPTS